jgi:hypothetical protein
MVKKHSKICSWPAKCPINANQKAISQALLDKHYLRKHGKEAYYGQK